MEPKRNLLRRNPDCTVDDFGCLTGLVTKLLQDIPDRRSVMALWEFGPLLAAFG
jgi:hypothetical protein